MTQRIMQPTGSANNNFEPNSSQMGATSIGGSMPPRGRPMNSGMPPRGMPTRGTPMNGGMPTRGGGMPTRGGGMPTRGGGMPTRGGGMPPRGGGMPPMGGGQPMRGGMPPMGGGMGQPMNPQSATPAKSKVSSETKWAILLLILIIFWFKMIFSAPTIIHNSTTPKEQLEQERIEKKEKLEEKRKYGDNPVKKSKTKIQTESKVY